MLHSARPKICHVESRPALRQPGSTTAVPGHCTGAACKLRHHVAPNPDQLQPESLRSAFAQQIRAQPVAAPDVALPQVQLPRLPLGFSLAAYPSLAGRNVLVTGVYNQPHPHPWSLHLTIMLSIRCRAQCRACTSGVSSVRSRQGACCGSQAAAEASASTPRSCWRSWVLTCTSRT
jgi:hypothetical protein